MSVKPIKTVFYENGRSVSVVINDLLYEPVDCIVNPANNGLSHGGGVAAEIAMAAGPTLEEECRKIIRERGRLNTGDAVVTTAGKLPFKGVIHVAGPRADDGAADPELALMRGLVNAFLLASEKGWVSLSFPAVSSGLFSVPLDKCAYGYARAAHEFFELYPDRSLETIRICLFKGPLVDMVLDEVEKAHKEQPPKPKSQGIKAPFWRKLEEPAPQVVYEEDPHRNMTGMKSFSAAVSIAKPGGETNADSVFSDDALGLHMVADGVGTHRHSARASALIVETASDLFQTSSEKAYGGLKGLLQKVVKKTALSLHQTAGKETPRPKMLSTLTLLCLHENRYHVIHAGDSRAYVFRDYKLFQITDDHSVAFQQYRAGAITKEQIRDHPNQRLLTRCFDADKDFVMTDYFVGAVERGDLFLVCSDGLTKVLSDEEIAGYLKNAHNLQGALETLVNEVKRRGQTDDVTMILATNEQV